MKLYNYKINVEYPTSFLTKELFAQIIAQTRYDYSIIEHNYERYIEYIVNLRSGSYLYHNSFLPQIKLYVPKADECSTIKIKYALHKSVVFLLSFILIFSIMLEMLFLVLCLKGQIVFSIVLLFPILLSAVFFLLTIYITSVYVRRINKLITRVTNKIKTEN